jgi:predicted GTPase
VDPRPNLQGTLKKTFETYPHIGTLLPAMGYSRQQIHDLEETINRTDCDLVLAATPIDLSKIVSIQKPVMRVRYEYGDKGSPTLASVLAEKLGV